ATRILRTAHRNVSIVTTLVTKLQPVALIANKSAWKTCYHKPQLCLAGTARAFRRFAGKYGLAKPVSASGRTGGATKWRRKLLCQARLPTAIAFTWRASFLVWQTRKRGNFLKLLVLLGGKLLSNNGRK
ncbi:MAG TPA: hypothetical protein VJ946_12645, partial [Bacteroidales bacterium]|nr:hypothetical protein [Bacteroidales bacterium]